MIGIEDINKINSEDVSAIHDVLREGRAMALDPLKLSAVIKLLINTINSQALIIERLTSVPHKKRRYTKRKLTPTRK